jgi:hypothetical protein
VGVQLWDGSPLPPGLRARLQREWEHAQFLHGKIVELEWERLRAIGPGGAWVYVNEFFGWRQFRNRKEVGGGRGAHSDAVPERGRPAESKDQQGGEPAPPGGGHRDSVVLAALPAPEPVEPLVSQGLSDSPRSEPRMRCLAGRGQHGWKVVRGLRARTREAGRQRHAARRRVA